MGNVLQFEIRNYIENHQLETKIQDDAVIVFVPVYKGKRMIGNEAHYVETYPEARQILSYAMVL